MYTTTTTTTTTSTIYVKKVTSYAAHIIPGLILGVLLGIPLLYLNIKILAILLCPCLKKKSSRSDTTLFNDNYVTKFNKKHIGNLINDSQQCSICLLDVTIKDEDKLILNCGHLFHKDCIENWILVHKTCPLCREQVIFLDLK